MRSSENPTTTHYGASRSYRPGGAAIRGTPFETTPPSKRRSSSSSSSRRTFAGSARLPPPTKLGATNRWYSSTNPASRAWAARSGTAHADEASRLPFHPPDRFGVEVSLDPGPCARYRLKRLGVDDLVGRTPNMRVVL